MNVGYRHLPTLFCSHPSVRFLLKKYDGIHPPDPSHCHIFTPTYIKKHKLRPSGHFGLLDLTQFFNHRVWTWPFRSFFPLFFKERSDWCQSSPLGWWRTFKVSGGSAGDDALSRSGKARNSPLPHWHLLRLHLLCKSTSSHSCRSLEEPPQMTIRQNEFLFQVTLSTQNSDLSEIEHLRLSWLVNAALAWKKKINVSSPLFFRTWFFFPPEMFEFDCHFLIAWNVCPQRLLMQIFMKLSIANIGSKKSCVLQKWSLHSRNVFV